MPEPLILTCPHGCGHELETTTAAFRARERVTCQACGEEVDFNLRRVAATLDAAMRRN